MALLSTSTSRDLGRARALAARGDVAAAREAYKALLAQAQRDAALLTEVGVFEASAGNAAAARRHLEKALKLSPSNPDIHYNLAELARQAGAIALAERHYRRAIAASPDHADAHYGLGESLRLLGRKEEALPFLIRAHELAPQDPEILNCLGISLEENGHQDDAEQAFRRALAADPRYQDARCNLAALLAERQDYQAADRLFAESDRAALPAVMLGRWANILLSLRRREDAASIAEEALRKDPRELTALNVKATVLQRKGHFDEAEQVARAIIKLDPRHADSYQRLATMRRLGEDAMEPLRRILGDKSLPPEQRATAGFALYALLDRRGDYPAAFTALSQANALRAEQRPYKPDYHEQLANRVMATFDRDFLASRFGEGMDEPGPIFILGMPRSGTTLVEQILAAYPQVHPGGERNDLNRLARSMSGYPEQAGIVASDWARGNALEIFADMRAEAPEKPFATNKAPGNYMFIGLIAWLFPRARIIYCKRDPLDNGLSCFEQNFELDISFSTDLRAFAHAYRLHERLMSHWFRASPVPIHTVAYEALVREPEPHARALVDYVGLPWDAECLSTEHRDRPIDTASVWQVRQPINAGAIGKWRRYERELAPLIEALREGEE
ncbi:tetratricopeptide repeat-containing sulfotransferase family protein [Rhodoligotrophos defluvii]|uniref:tetratricopeptide repeat-containing sulfotransferase family protein n=1 Tax=Rhodoligotrophos defluvii TaxID=2561934 RepID=UPI0010C98A20|nr:tetratricopeptide repeat-containing sulfotransferase family protein [Rhodoligotrophos defluvii]